MKKKLSLLLAALLVMTLVPVSSFAYKTSESSPFTVDYGQKGAAAKRTYTIEFDLETTDTIATGETIRFDLSNAEFDALNVVSGPLGAPSVSGSLATVMTTGSTDGKFKVSLVVNTEDSDEGDVMLTITNDLVGKSSYKIGTVKEEATKNLNVVVDNKDKTVSMSGGSLSKFEVKNYDKTKDVVIEFDGDNVDFDAAATKVNGSTGIANVTKSANMITVNKAFFNTNTFLVIEPVVQADRRMELGSVDIDVTNGDNTASAKIGEVVDYEVAIKVVENGKKEIPTVVGGKETTLKVTLSGTKGSITQGRAYEITLDGATVAHNASGTILSVDGTNVVVEGLRGIKEEGRTDEFTVSTSAADATKIEFTMKVKVDATAKDGVATMSVSSKDLDGDLTADIAKVSRAYGVDTMVTEIKRGESSETADIVVTETKIGQIAVGEYVRVSLNGKSLFNEKPKFEATNGMEFDDVEWYKVDKETVGVQAKVTKKSKGDPAEITISGPAVDMLSNGIQGRVYTASLFIGAKNAGTEYAEFDYTKCVAEYSRTAAKIVFTLGSANYTVDGVVMTLEAPVFTKDNRTMLPIGPLALALGLEVNYNADTQTATFRDSFTGQVVSVKENATMLYNNGIEYKMHTAAVTVNGRIFVPVASITDAFGAKILWDEATQTVTIN